jgi:hypothetical protein
MLFYLCNLHFIIPKMLALTFIDTSNFLNNHILKSPKILILLKKNL